MRYARSAGYLDWATQPHPFREFRGASQFDLPFAQPPDQPAYASLYAAQPVAPAPLQADTVGEFLQYAMGLSAWKRHSAAKWSLRVNPSSGNLHPTEAYLLMPAVGDLPAGLFHYRPDTHALELRRPVPPALAAEVFHAVDDAGVLVGLSSIHWRESWKYGERAYRYCHHDVGHAIGALRLSAQLLGWRLTWLSHLGHDDVQGVLGIQPDGMHPFELEEGDALFLLQPADAGPIPPHFLLPHAEALAALPTAGQPNQLSDDHVDWDAVAVAAHVCRKPRSPLLGAVDHGHPPLLPGPDCDSDARSIIKGRRSAQAYDGATSVTLAELLSMLDKTLPRPNNPPFDVHLGEAMVNLVLFVHRVEGLNPGLYAFVRNPDDFEALRATLYGDYSWRRVAPGQPLFELAHRDITRHAMALSCNQAIAGDGAFSLAMLANFDKSVRLAPSTYPALYWECGLIGQVLYLEAEAHGYRATGIGCFFDDLVHEFLGIRSVSFQSLYHFTIGFPLEDTRLQTLAAYHHLERA